MIRGGFSRDEALSMPLSRMWSARMALRSIEAEERLGFVMDVGSALVGSKGDGGHLRRLARLAAGPRGGDAGGRLMVDDEKGRAVPSGTFVPGKTYVEH
jgi:hypothetical protein